MHHEEELKFAWGDALRYTIIAVAVNVAEVSFGDAVIVVGGSGCGDDEAAWGGAGGVGFEGVPGTGGDGDGAGGGACGDISGFEGEDVAAGGLGRG